MRKSFKFPNKANILVMLAMAMLTVSIWAHMNRPEAEPSWPKTIKGFSFSPARIDHDPLDKVFPSESQIEDDIKLLAGKTYAIRTYSMDEAYEKIPEIAKKYDINVALGAWLDTRMDNNEMK